MLDGKPYQFHVIVPLWGPDYIAQARKFLFSSLLAPGNLGGIPINLHIVGKKSEEALVVGCPEWQPIAKLCNAQFDGLAESVFEQQSYFAMSQCYDHALEKYEAPTSVFVFLTGDIVLAQNTFSFLQTLVEQGYRAAMVPGPRVCEEAVEHLRTSDGVLVATGRDLMRAMWEKPLALTVGYQVMANGRNKCPNHYYWRVGNYSTLARTTMMHPLMVWPNDTSIRVVCPPIGANAASAALDQGYMRYAVAKPESIYIAHDSDKLAVVSISDDKHFSNDIMIEEGYTLEQEKGIFSAYCNDYHFWYGAHDLFLKGEEVDPAAWAPAQAQAAATFKTKMDFVFGTPDPTVNAVAPAAQNAQPAPQRRRFSGMRRVRNLIARIPYVRPLYNKGIRFVLPSLGRVEASAQSQSLQINNLVAYQNHLTAGHNDVVASLNHIAATVNQLGGAINEIQKQVADIAQKVARFEPVTDRQLGRIVSLESGIQTTVRQFNAINANQNKMAAAVSQISAEVSQISVAVNEQFDAVNAKVSQMPSPDTLRMTQLFLTDVFASYRWLENCDPDSITCKAPLGHHSPLRARYIYKDSFYVAVDYLISNNILGPVLEFGTRSGFTSRCLGEVMAERNYPGKLYLFDSFEGLPEITSRVDLYSPEVRDQKVWFKGAMAMPADTVELIARDLQKFMQPYQFEIVKGFFADTMPMALPQEPAALIHLDCDLYQSTIEVLNALNERNLLQNGSVIMLDDYNTSKADPNMGERRALSDFLRGNKAFSVSPFMSYGWHGQAFILHVASQYLCQSQSAGEQDSRSVDSAEGQFHG